jgi:hypothetical protein
MVWHSRLKDGVALLAYVPAISILGARRCHSNRDRRDKPGDDEREGSVGEGAIAGD